MKTGPGVRPGPSPDSSRRGDADRPTGDGSRSTRQKGGEKMHLTWTVRTSPACPGDVFSAGPALDIFGTATRVGFCGYTGRRMMWFA